MDKQEILTILDSLDIQVSMGRIDQPTYEALRQKWKQQLQEEPGAHGSTHLSEEKKASEAPPVLHSLQVLACPKCAAPVPLSENLQDLSRPIRCPFCDTVYTLRQGQDNADQLKKELLAWFNRVVVSTGQAGNAVDINARRYIFHESLYPILKKETERRLEVFDTVLELPLIQLKETSRLREYQPDARLLQLAQGDNQWLKTLVTRVMAEQLQHFAVVPEDRQKVQQLQIRVQNLIYYANLAQQYVNPQGPSYPLIQQNIQALQKSYQPLLQDSSDEEYRAFLAAQDARATAALKLIEVMETAFDEQQGVVPEWLVVQVKRTLELLEQARTLAESCRYMPLATVSLQHGIKKDLVCAQIFQAAVTAYELVTRTMPCPFPTFYRSLLHYVWQLTAVHEAEHLFWLLTSVSRVIQARATDAPLPIIKDWRWLEGAIARQRRSGFLGLGGEKSSLKTRFFHPYWVASVQYSDLDGALLKKANVREGLLLIDASSATISSIKVLRRGNPDLASIKEGMRQFAFFDKPFLSLPALVTHTVAERALKGYLAQHTHSLKVLSSRMLGVVYLPAAIVAYHTRQKRREQVLSQIALLDQDIVNNLALTQDFFSRYML